MGTGRAQEGTAVLDGEKMLFLAGLHRSGTTVLAKVLADHPDVSGFDDTGVPADEGQHLQTVFSPGTAFGGPGRFALHPGARMDETRMGPDDRARLSEQWSPYLDTSRRYLLEKSPPNLIRMRYFQAVFPGARFLLVLRHPLVVAMATQKWSRNSYGALLKHWLAAYDLCVEDARSVERLMVVTYEDLTRDPEATLTSVYRWLGLSLPVVGAAGVRSSNGEYVDRWRREQQSTPTWLYGRGLELRFERRVGRYGYSLKDLTAAPRSLTRVFPGATTCG